MGYQALLFCPDEKTARTVTQVLSELEFNVEPCNETFAAVKKLMGTHFDAVVVDCDNEQNATLLFKSARNSTSNQASLAVAVVEGQAGVAKAFRIGANLVLTKPINIEQAKGTLRVARGLLRKGEAPKTGAPATAASATPAATPTVKPAPSPAKPVAAKPVAPVRSATPPAAASLPVPPVVKPAAPAWPAQAAVASSVPAAHDHDEDLPEISLDDDILDTPATPPPKFPTPPVPAVAAESKPAFKATAQTSLSPTSGSGAASAPAPARIADVPTSPEPPAITSKEAEPVASSGSSTESVADPHPTLFTFGGAAVAEEPGKSKKILLVVAVIVIVAAAAYAGWSFYQGRASQPVTPAPKPATRTLTANPTPAQSVNAAATPAPATAIPASPIASQTAAVSEPKANPSANSGDSLPENDAPAASAKATSSPAPIPAKSAPATAKPDAPAPLIVKGGTAPASHPATEAADAPAPSMMGMATTGSSAPPNIGGGAGSAPKPILQTVNISQGVSQGLLIKKVAPIYPKTAMTMHIDGTVRLLATISKSGDITDIKVVSGDQRLVKAATDAVHQWKYKPYLLDGEPVEIQTPIALVFKSPN
jgi:protein TonB